MFFQAVECGPFLNAVNLVRTTHWHAIKAETLWACGLINTSQNKKQARHMRAFPAVLPEPGITKAFKCENSARPWMRFELEHFFQESVSTLITGERKQKGKKQIHGVKTCF